MARRKANGDVMVRVSNSPLGHSSASYKLTVQKWTDEDWVLIEESPKGAFLELTFRYKRYVLRPNLAIIGPGQSFPTAPHPSRFLSLSEAQDAAKAGGFLIDETEPAYRKMGVK